MAASDDDKRLKGACARLGMRARLTESFTAIELGPWKVLEGAVPGYYNADFSARDRKTGVWVAGNIGYDPDSHQCAYGYAETEKPERFGAPVSETSAPSPRKRPVALSFSV